jgi:hypothetical protein
MRPRGVFQENLWNTGQAQYVEAPTEIDLTLHERFEGGVPLGVEEARVPDGAEQIRSFEEAIRELPLHPAEAIQDVVQLADPGLDAFGMVRRAQCGSCAARLGRF